MKNEKTKFIHLNRNWNADPNAPEPRFEQDGNDLILGFDLNSFIYDTFQMGDYVFIRFHSCSRFRMTAVNDEGWSRGQCRFSKLAPQWGEFYEIVGDFREGELNVTWTTHASPPGSQRNFLFYFRDEMFGCSALDWSLDARDENTLRKLPTDAK